VSTSDRPVISIANAAIPVSTPQVTAHCSGVNRFYLFFGFTSVNDLLVEYFNRRLSNGVFGIPLSHKPFTPRRLNSTAS